MFIVKPETVDDRNVGTEEVAVTFKSIQREATESSRKLRMEHSSRNLQDLPCGATGFLILVIGL